MTPGLRVERPEPGVALVVLDRPSHLNALDDGLLLDELPDAVADLARDDGVRAVVITGEGRGFCAGADLDCSGFTQPTAARAEEFMRRSHRTPVALRRLAKPTIAALKGPVVGAGFGLALACDFRFSSDDVRIGSPFVTMGLVPDYGVTYFLPRLIGTDRALDLLLTGRLVGAEEAARLGLVTRLCPDVMEESLAFAATLAAAPPLALAATRANTYRSMDLDLETEVGEEVRTQAIAIFGSEFPERFSQWKQGIRGRGPRPGAGG